MRHTASAQLPGSRRSFLRQGEGRVREMEGESVSVCRRGEKEMGWQREQVKDKEIQ